MDEMTLEQQRAEAEARARMVQAQNSDSLSQLRTMTGGVLEGIPVVGPMIRGGVERAAAATIAPFSDETYSQVLQRIQRGSQEEKAANPGLNTASQITGAVGGTIPMVLAAPEAFGAGGGSLLARALASMVTGGAIGGTDAAVRSGGNPSAALNGLEWGAGLGLVAPGVGSLLGAGTRALASRFGPQLSSAEKLFGSALNRDAVTNPGASLSDLGPSAMPMDLGPNLQRQAGALAATPGEAQGIVRSAIAERQAAAGPRVTQAADTALGGPVNTDALAESIIAKRSAAAQPLYQAAYAKQMPFTPQLKQLLQRPAMSKALKQAQTLAANDENAAPKQFFAKVTDQGRGTGIMDASGNEIRVPNEQVQFIRTPNVEELDLTKRALDDMISTAQRQGNNNEARIYTQLKNSLTGMVDSAVPEYAQARAAFAGPSSVLDAMEEGRNVFKNSMTPTQLASRLMTMSPTEKEAFIQGARAQISDIMGTARNDANAARATFDKGYNREKLAALIGKDNAAKMLGSLDAEKVYAGTRNIVTGNSETAARVAAQGEIAPTKQPGLLRSAFNMRFGDAAADIGDKALGKVTDSARQARNTELARLLTTNDPKNAGRILKLAQAAKNRGDITAEQAKQIGQSLVIASSQRRRPLEITVTPGRF